LFQVSVKDEWRQTRPKIGVFNSNRRHKPNSCTFDGALFGRNGLQPNLKKFAVHLVAVVRQMVCLKLEIVVEQLF
jgi:hypothetical protein